MTSPTWSAVDSDTGSLLDLVAHDQTHPRPADEWHIFTDAIRSAAGREGRVDPNVLRDLLRGCVAPRRIGAFTNRAKAEGLLTWDGEWVESTDHEGRNGGKPIRVYRLGGAR